MEKSNTIFVRRFPNGTVETQKVEPQPLKSTEQYRHPIVKNLRNLGIRMSLLEMDLLRRRNIEEFERRSRNFDPPCIVDSVWSDDWLCEQCRKKFPWMHPDFGGR